MRRSQRFARHTVGSVSLALAAAATAWVGGAGQAEVLLFDLGLGSSTSGSNYNNFTANGSITDAVDNTGTATDIDVTVAGFNTSTANGNGSQTPTGDASIFLASATRDSLFGNTFSFSGTFPNPTVTFSDLDANTVYSFVVFASRTGVGDSRKGTYEFISGGPSLSIDFEAANNHSEVIEASGLTPDVNGEIKISLTEGPNNNSSHRFTYLNAIQVTTEAVPEPGTLTLGAMGLLAMCKRRPRR